MAGDMFLGACLDLGLPEAVLAEALGRLGLPGVGIEIRKASRGGVVGTRFRVLEDGKPIEGPDPEEEGNRPSELGHGHPHRPEDLSAPAPEPHHSHRHAHGPERSLAEIRDGILGSALSAPVKERALQLFSRLGEAEARVHGVAIERVHFHEVGAVDAIVDLVGAAVAIEHLAPERLTCGPVNVGGGTVGTAHGELPVPAPATALLLRGVPIYGSPHGELLTPTGAVLLAELVDEFTELPPLAIEAVGYGLGKRQLGDRPNAVRLMRGRVATESSGTGSVMVIECEIDHLPGEAFGFLLERLLGAGALDAFFTAVQMKKNRPGTLVTVLCRRERLEAMAGLLLAESGSLGCRYYAAARFEAERSQESVETPWGLVRIKRGVFGGRALSASPEYEDCRRIAIERGIPWREVWRAALAASGGVS